MVVNVDLAAVEFSMVEVATFLDKEKSGQSSRLSVNGGGDE